MIHEIAEKFMMRSNGYAMFHDDNFYNHHDLPCYIPENAEDRHDIYSFNDIYAVVSEWLTKKDAIEYLLECYDGVLPVFDDEFICNWCVRVYEHISWEHPSTFLESILQ